ncbi:hypothetical protein [Paraburkholderia sp. BL17N1]|uniref:hypothetical protein n=1 Tax=Paraburkholderia sp. BL17N1 TaxID=1938798 RepID=UPI0011C48E8E|nr:hypothetical protein [Paraburkholderia sp. BL17N1]
MNTSRRATPEEERLVTSFHEAGHLAVTHASSYFGLLDPAVKIDLNGPLSAISGVTRIRDTREKEHHLPSGREYVRIALAGKAAEEEFLRRQTSAQRLIPDPDGANADLRIVHATLAALGIEHEYEQLWREVTELVERNWDLIQRVAQMISVSQHNEISRAAVLQILSAQ